MLKSTSNRGRPKAQYKPKLGGDPIIGLMRLKDGRWRVSGREKITYTEPDEKLAIARFRQIEARLNGAERVMVPVGTANVHDAGPLVKKAMNPRVEVRIPRDHSKGVTVSHSFDTDEAWAWFRQQLLTQPKYVAQRVGIEQIGYLQNIKQPSFGDDPDAGRAVAQNVSRQQPSSVLQRLIVQPLIGVANRTAVAAHMSGEIKAGIIPAQKRNPRRMGRGFRRI